MTDTTQPTPRFELHLNAPDTPETRAALERAAQALIAELTADSTPADAALFGPDGDSFAEWNNDVCLNVGAETDLPG